MTDLDLSTLMLTWIIEYGSPVVAVALLVGALGLPVPGTLIVIATGAFIRQELLDVYTTPLLALVGAVTGDMVVYGVGRFAHGWIERRFGQSATWQKARDYFERRGGIAIYLTRWLVTPLAIPTNLIAGSSGYPFLKFLLFDIAGEVTWIALYGGLGYTFGDQWELISEFISNFSGLIVSLLAIGAGVYLIVRFWKKPKSQPVLSN
ncbi:MAG: DedA family protein [Chloroflexi bacterium]|nr:DedA family protein [Chloroflexota bacterium]